MCVMRRPAGGQKVKVVIAAAMWQNPHLLVLDEPTNYLDRESLGALASAIREYGGGVVMISHSSGAKGTFTLALAIPCCVCSALMCALYLVWVVVCVTFHIKTI